MIYFQTPQIKLVSKGIIPTNIMKLISLSILLLLVACQSTPKRQTGDATQQTSEEEQNLVGSAQGQDAVLNSIEQALQEVAISKARRLLRKVKPDDLSKRQLFRYRIAIIEFYRISGKTKQAENAIVGSHLDFLDGIPLSEQIDLFLLYARVLEDKGDVRTALRMLILADERLSAKDGRENQKQLIRLLEQLSMPELLREARLAPDLYMRGWYDFAMLRHLDNSYGRADAQTLWKSRYSRHPGNRYLKFIASRQAEVLQVSDLPPNKKNIKVSFLLPFNDKTLGVIAESIVEGYKDMARNYGIRLNILSLDTASDRSMADLYARAVDQESDIVIGPLRKERVQELYTEVKNHGVPIIALNDVSQNYRGKNNFYILGSNFEKNVEFSATVAWDHQCRNIAMIAQDESLLAERGLRAFTNKWKELGGNIETAEVLTKDKKMTEWISGILEVDNQEVDANKEVFRRYLLKLTQLGVSQDNINLLLGGNSQKEELPNVLPFPDRSFLITQEELSIINDEYYKRPPQWIEYSLEAQLYKRLELINLQEDEDAYTKAELESLMLDFILESQGSYSRAEAECIFLAMDSIHLAKVRPFISFYLANDIPLFSTFLAYDRSSRRAEYSDLEGITYGEFPGVLNRHKKLANDKVFVKRFYLTGRDALLLTQTLSVLNNFSATDNKKARARSASFDYYVLGEAGLLYMDNNQIYNIPREVTFSSGWPRRQSRLSIFQ